MDEKKLILLSVDAVTHDQYKALLKQRQNGECIRYVLGDAATAKMKREIACKVG